MIFLLFVLFLAGMGALVWYALQAKKSRDPWSLSKGYEVRGIDLSHHNGRIRYDEIDSLDFVFLKVTEGVSVTDKTFAKHYSAFREKEMAVGAYHFFRFDIDGKEQARHFLHHLSGKEFQLPLIVDVEYDNNPDTPREKVITRLQAFVNEVKKRTGIMPIIYTNGIGYSDFISDDFDDHTLWLSSTNAWRPAMMGCTFWQFNINADLSAITHDVDLNVFRGSREEWEEYLQEHKPFVVSSN
ncbi:GH25 family lysozyme [Aquirufa sp. HETE-83D]|uniref:GH25 family lysozyme n=1 Tax=Aquirufa esocilacus TaxID=3096513 RepID=A0ABW6DHB9_9BACT